MCVRLLADNPLGDSGKEDQEEEVVCGRIELADDADRLVGSELGECVEALSGGAIAAVVGVGYGGGVQECDNEGVVSGDGRATGVSVHSEGYGTAVTLKECSIEASLEMDVGGVATAEAELLETELGVAIAVHVTERVAEETRAMVEEADTLQEVADSECVEADDSAEDWDVTVLVAIGVTVSSSELVVYESFTDGLQEGDVLIRLLTTGELVASTLQLSEVIHGEASADAVGVAVVVLESNAVTVEAAKDEVTSAEGTAGNTGVVELNNVVKDASASPVVEEAVRASNKT